MIFTSILALVGVAVTTTTNTTLFISGVTAGTSTYIGVKRNSKSKK